MKQFIVYLLGCLMVLSGCDGDDAPKAKDIEYFPLQTGSYQVYSVEKTVYSELNPPESFVYELKTEVTDFFVNQEGGVSYVVHLSTRATPNDPWQFQEVWSARTNQYQAIVTEGNVSYVRVSFPIIKNKEWNGNELNSLGEDLYEFTEVGDSFDPIGGQEFDDCIVILQEQSLDFTTKDERQEVYARNVGLIYKFTVNLTYCNDGMTVAEGGCVGLYKIKSGVEYVQVLKDYGQN